MSVYLAVALLMVLNELIIVGVWSVCRKGMAFEAPADWIWSKAGPWLGKPLFNCLPCMASVYGTAFFFLSSMREFVPLWFWPIHCLTLCGAGTVLQPLLDEH